MTAREKDLLRINGLADSRAGYDLEKIYEGALSARTVWYGERLRIPTDTNWWDTFSSLMLSKHKTSISSLNDDNRQDEKEIEILETALNISDQDLDNLIELRDFYKDLYQDALLNKNESLWKKYKNLMDRAQSEYDNKLLTINAANDIVSRDKNLIDSSGHNPIMEAIGEMIDYTSAGAGAGAVVTSASGPGAAIGAAIGGALGFGYGILDYFASGRNDIDRSAYSTPLSKNRNENYKNSIITRQSYKNFRAKLILNILSDLLWWQSEYPVSEYYRYMEAAGTGNYLYYNLPGIVGSSFSDTKDLGQQLVGTAGLNKLASKVPNSAARFGIRALSFFEAIRNGWLQSLNENHAETSDTASKKVIDQIRKNKELRSEMLYNAKKVATDLYKLSKHDADKLIDDEVALTMYQGGIGGLNPRTLQNSYDYYRSARQAGDAGADTQFLRDMMATAGGDILEAALMVTPYGALAKKSKIIGRAVAGAAVGAATGEAIGFGVGGSILGGAFGGIVAQNRFARRLWNGTMKKVLAIEDKILPTLEKLIMFDKGMHAVAAFGVTALAEAAEEGVQYLNSLDAEKILNKADDDINLRGMKNLFINDLKKRGEVFNAVLSQIGLTESPYLSDQEFWSNWKGGLVLGGLMTGAVVSLNESLGAKKAYQAAKFFREEILSSAVANRTASQDAILKGAAFAKYGKTESLEAILDIIDRAKLKNKNREGSVYSDKDFDDLSEQAGRIISKLNHKTTRERLKQLGYELGSEEANYALAANDYYWQKTRENESEEQNELPEKIRLMNDPKVIEALNTIAGPEPIAADEFDSVNDDRFTYKTRKEDGTVEEKTISNRERLALLHQNTAELIAVTQLLKDLQDILKILEFARSQGVAFGKGQIDSTISLLKDKYNLLKRDVELYANEQFDSTSTTYDQQIEHLKGYLLDQESGLKLADLYRNSTLRMLNQRVYTNIIRSLAIDTQSDTKNDEVKAKSKDMAKRFVDNVKKNKQLLEILDYNVENESENTETEQTSQQASTEDVATEEPVQEDTGQNFEPDEQETEQTEEPRKSWFQRLKDRINSFFSEDENTFEETQEESEDVIMEDDQEEDSSSEPTLPEHPNVEVGPDGTLRPAETDSEQSTTQPAVTPETQEETEEPPQVIPDDVESTALPQDPEEQVAATVLEDNDLTNEVVLEDVESAAIPLDPEEQESNEITPQESESAVIINEGLDEENKNQGAEERVVDNNQQETINRLSTRTEDSPRKLIDGWYVTKDGRIIPSDKMYMMNPVETPKKLGAQLAQKYRTIAAQIRFNIHRHLISKDKDSSIKLKLYVGKMLKTADPTIVDTVTKAIQNGDQNAIKLLIIQLNPRAWDSYYVNEFFRDAARRILNGNPVTRPEYIDKEAFKNFCRQVLLYKKLVESIYGYKFVTNIAPSVTKINGEEVVSDPDFIAVDAAGNAHIVNIYTINNKSYKQQMQRAETYIMSLGNTKNLFSQHQERNILADILMKGIKDGVGVIVSSASLLPVVVDGYTAVNRLYLGKLVPLSPNDDSITKYANQEDLLLELKELLVKANEKAKTIIEEFNNTLENLKNYRRESKRSGRRIEKRTFDPDSEPASIAEAYAQLDKALEVILSALNYYAKHMAKEVSEMEAFYKEQSKLNKLPEIAKRIEEINKIEDETSTTGILVEVLDGELVINNSDIITNGVAKAVLKTSPDGTKYVLFVVEYKGRTYPLKIYRNRDKKYGKKNGDIFKQNEHPIFTEKRKKIEQLLTEYPDLVLTFDLRRSFIKYGEDNPGSKPRGITEKDGLLSQIDVENLGVQQDDGKIVDIGFYDEKSGAILTGQDSMSATLAHAPEGQWWQNLMFLVIKQKHLEELKAPDRHVAIPLIRLKFNKKLARFIAACYKVVAETNHQAGYDSLKKRMFANQMLHLFISKRMVYKKGEQELPNIIYINGDAVRVNGKEFFILTDSGFLGFVDELQKCEIMPSWDTFNAKFKNLASGPFSQLYDHFSTSKESLKISIDGIDSGLEITADQFNNDTLCQWLVKNQFFASKHFVAREPVVSIHNVKLASNVQQLVQEELKQNALTVKEAKPEQKPSLKEEPIVMSEEEFNKLGLEEVGEDEEDEEDEYSYVSTTIPINSELNTVRNIKNSEDLMRVLRGQYPRLVKLLNIAINKIGLPDIKIVVSNLSGETAIVDGVELQKQGSVKLNEDGSWKIIIFKSAKHPIKTLAHETVHIFTLGAILKNTACAKACKVFYLYCKDSFVKDKTKPYGFHSFKEFIAEFFTNDEFREYLRSKDPMAQNVFDIAIKNLPELHKSRIRTMYDSVISFFSKIWLKYVLRESPSLYSLIYDTMEQIFGDAQNTRVNEESNEYTIKNHATLQKVTLQNCKSRAQLRAAIDGIMTAWIEHENITALGKNIDKLNFSTEAILKRLEQDAEFAQWYLRTFTYSDKPLIRELTALTRPTRDDLKTKDNPEGFVLYEKKVKTIITIKKKDGTTVTKVVKMPKTFTTIKLTNWDLITPVIDEFMSDMRIETRKKILYRKEDLEIEEREDGRNTFGELLTESYEIDPFDRASREVKWMFSTVPYGKVVQDGELLRWEATTDHNEFGMTTYMPFKDVYGKVLYYTANCRSTTDILNRFKQLAQTGPDKAMFLYLYFKLSELIANRWKPIQEVGNKSNPTKNSEGLFFDANIDSTIIKVIRALRLQLNDFIWTTAEDVVDKDGNKQKQIDIKTTLYQKKSIETTRNWKDQLSTGMSGVLKYDTETLTYKFLSQIKGNLFLKIYRDLFIGKNSFINAYNKLRQQDPEDVTLDWLYLLNSGNIKFSEITSDDVKTYLHNALLHCGVDISEEIIDQWLFLIKEGNPTIKTDMDALYAMLSDQHSNIRPANFFARLANINESGMGIDESITAETLDNAFNSGFVKELANLLNEYDLRTQGLMTVAAHNNLYYIVSESNYVNDVKDIINSGDRNDSYIQMLIEDSFASGSVIVEAMNRGESIHLDVGTFVGMKTKNVGDQGRDYFEIELNEDIISKLELLHEGWMISPTTSDKKTYHTIKGIPLVGMMSGVRSNTQCYYVDYKTGEITITDTLILDRFISYFKSERDAVEKAIVAYETGFYKKHPGKKIANYSDKNGMKFSSFCCLPMANGEKIFLNKDTSSPRDNLNAADNNFFKLSRYEQRKIMQRILLQRAAEEMKQIVDVGLVKQNENGQYENIGLDGATILDMAERRVKAIFGENGKLSDYVDENGKHAGPRKAFAISSAILEYVLDCAIKHLMSMQEYQRLFSGSKAFYKWKSKGEHVVDISVDYTKRRGGDISTGGVNIYDIDPIAGMEELGTYRCIEIEDYLVESSTLGQLALIQLFETSELVSVAASIVTDTHNDNASQMNILTIHRKNAKLLRNLYEHRDLAEEVVRRKYGEDFVNVLKLKAKANAMQYFRDIKDKENPINIADGATYITDRMCERLLREEGKWDDDMKYAFEVLRGEHGADVLSKKGQKLYKSILDVVIGTLKYTATGFRKSDDGLGGTLMTPYYNKTALFPVFEQIAYGRMKLVLDAMRKNKVDVMMMTSAVKTGNLGAITIELMLSDLSYTEHTYIQEIRFLRKQLNTDPNEREEMNLGTQTIKIALSNLRMLDDYIDPFTGKTVKGRELYQNIMRCYNILTDIGYEQVMMRFAKKRPDGLPAFNNSLPAVFDENGDVISVDTDILASIPDIDEKALSDFLRNELKSRDANDNMFDAIAYDNENDRLSAPVSAISQSGWIDSILSAYISKTIIDTKSPGAAYILRSVFCMEGEGFKTINNGDKLKLINEDGSMDAVVSIDFFTDILKKCLPNYKDLTFEEVRQWLIDHKLVGKDAKTYTISYRIPTQAQSSINPLKFVDVIPVVRDTIILPEDFTKLTGSDFDIDKLFLSRLFVNPETVHNEEQMFTYLDNKDNSNKDELLDTLHKAFTNKLFLNYITLLMDKNSANTKWRPIDADTELWKEVHRDLYPTSQSPVESLQQDTIVYQTQLKNNFVVGKIGIGPFALNNNNHIYTMLYNISVKTEFLGNLGLDGLNMNALYRGTDIYGNSIMSWLSGGINAHVDIAKDPFVTLLNINKYTYNIANFLIRAGFGKNALWFLNQPVIKELAKRQNNITGQYLKATTKSLFDALKEVLENYKKELADQIPEEVLNSEIRNEYFVEVVNQNNQIESVPCLDIIQTALGRPLTVRDVLLNRADIHKAISFSGKLTEEQKSIGRRGVSGIYQRDFAKPYGDDMVEKDVSKSMIYREAKSINSSTNISSNAQYTLNDAVLRYMSIVMFDNINSNEAKITSDIVKFTKIDTKKHGSTIAAQLDYRIEYQKFIAGLSSTHPKVFGYTGGLFGISIRDDADFLGSLSSLDLSSSPNIMNHTGLPGTSINFESGDITESHYIKYDRGDYSSFIHNKTRKAINALTSVLRNDSVESTYGFEYIWRVVKNDFGKSSLTEDMLKKLRATILGAIKSQWVFSKMKSIGIDPISLFKDGENTLSLAHELVKMKTQVIRHTDENYVNRRGEVRRRTTITTVAKLFKDNALLKILHDAHSNDEYSQTGRLTDILDFIKVHIPFTDDKKNANVYINAWRDLYENDLTKDFAIKLMFYSFIVSNDEGGSNLFKYVPFEMLLEYGLFDAERATIEYLNDPAFFYTENFSELEKAIRPIVDRVETILCEDFDFSEPFHLESRENVLQYTGFASSFGNKVVKNGQTEKADRIPYVFIPVKPNSFGTTTKSKTLVDSNGNLINRPYIRVYNPVSNYENQLRYFIYKRIGQIYMNKYLIVPIYQLVNSSMYTLGQYKVYNYDNEMPISSTEILKTIENYVYSEKYSINDLNGWISHVVKLIEDANAARMASKKGTRDIRTAAGPLYTLDVGLEEMHKEVRLLSIRTDILSKFDDFLYLEVFKNRHNTGRENMISDLKFVGESDLFTEEEKSIASRMLADILQLQQAFEQAKVNKKSPKSANDPTTYHMHSGGAYGADTMWDYYGKQYGMPDDPQHFAHYYFGSKTPNGNVSITKDLFIEGLDHVFAADQTLLRFDKMSEDRQRTVASLLARNWMLVKNSDAVFAIGEIKYGKVDGETGWAVLMAIDSGKPVHVFNLSTEQWFTYDREKRTWVVESTPKLTKNFAGIGTRSIDRDIEQKTSNYKKPVKYVGDLKRQAAINAINDVYRNTFGEPKKHEETKPSKTPLQSAIEKAEGFIGETNGSVYLKLGDKFVLKSGTQLLDTLKTITDRGHNPGKWSFGDDYDGQVSYNIGYESGTNVVMSLTNRDLYDEGWMPSTILVMREDNRIGNPLDRLFKLNIDLFAKNVTFLVSEKDKPLLEYLNSESYKYEIYDKSSTEDTEVSESEKGVYTENGKPIVMYRGYALTEDREANSIEETIGHTAVDYDESLKGSIYFTSDPEEAMDYAKTRTDKSDETFIDLSGQKVTQRNRHYTGDFAKVSAYNISADAKVEHYKDMKDYVLNGKNSNADVIILDRGTMWTDNSEYIVRNKNVIVKAGVEVSKKEPVFTKVNDAFAEVLIKHLLNDPMPGYETKEKREFLANLARGVFQWIKRERFKVLITNAPYSDVEAGKTSTVSIFASFATIYYQDVDLQGNKYLNILHELLHIITKQAIPFDSMGRAIDDEKMQLYYDLFKKKILTDPEWNDIRDVVFNPTLETFDKASNRAKILAHAYSDAGEFISCCISNVEVQLVLESITYDETQKSTLFDEIKRWFGELIDKIFRGNEKLSHSNFIEDVTNFLFDVKYGMDLVHQTLDSGDFEALGEYLKYIDSLRKRYDNAIDFGSKNASKKEISPELSVDPESWSKKEGWSVDYFNTEVKPRINEAWLIEYELAQIDESSLENILDATMYFVYGTNKRPDVKSDTTFDAILNGERTATTRYESDKHIDFWKNFKEGDLIRFHSTKDWWKGNSDDRSLIVRVTRAAHKLSGEPENTNEEFIDNQGNKKVSVSTTPYTSESVKNPRTAVVFTENMLAEYARRKNTPSSSTLKLNVTEGTTGTNQAVVRMSNDTTYNPNAFGLIVKKYQQDNHGRWFYDDKGNFLDTDADFTMFKEANEAMFNRLSSFDGDTIVFPASAAMGKAALPKRFAEWLAQELYNRYGLFTVVKPNPKYLGKYGVYIYLNTGSINVYSKSKTSITNLSNFEYRVFKTQLAKDAPLMTVQSVEHAFLMSKLTFAWLRGDITDQQFWLYIDQMKKSTGSEVKSIGRSIPMSLQTISEWNLVRDKVLEFMMTRSFLQNLEAAAELLRTENAEITHNYDNGSPIEPKTPRRFGDLLKKVRSKLRDEQQLKNDCK